MTLTIKTKIIGVDPPVLDNDGAPKSYLLASLFANLTDETTNRSVNTTYTAGATARLLAIGFLSGSGFPECEIELHIGGVWEKRAQAGRREGASQNVPGTVVNVIVPPGTDYRVTGTMPEVWNESDL